MARPTEWIQHLDRAIEELSALTASTVDRRTLEKLFAVSPRQALRLLARVHAYPAGTSLLVDRLELLRTLEAHRQDPAVQGERQRKERVEAELARVRQERRARQIEIQTTPAIYEQHVADLPTSICLQPGRLAITFADTQDLLQHLFTLSQAIANDYLTFQRLCEPSLALTPKPFIT